MASVGHLIVGMAAGRAWAPRARPLHVVGAMAVFSALSVLPDLDVLSFRLGIPYGSTWGHRGASHSLALAVLAGLAAALVGKLAGLPLLRTWAFVAIVVASHGVLDAFTDGGKGVALFWPFSDERIFFPWRPLPVSRIGFAFVSAHGLRVIAWELLWLSPVLAYAAWPRRAAEAARKSG